MSLTPEVDKRICERFEALESEGKRLVELMDQRYPVLGSEGRTYTSAYYKLKTNFLNLIQMLATKKNSFSDLIKDVRNARERLPEELLGMIAGLKSDYESGMLQSITEMIEANVTADYLDQAEQLLSANKQGQYNHVPAAVLVGAVLEDSLRRLCLRQSPPISTNKSGGQPKTLSTLVEDLKNAGLFNELKAKHLRAWTDIRNAAAHGRFDEFSRSDVEQMISGIQSFLADHL